MFKGKTTFIIGAGSSYELNLPLGNELCEQVASMTTPISPRHGIIFNDPQFQEAVQNYLGYDLLRWHNELSRIQVAASGMGQALRYAPSIDNYIHTHRNDEHVVALGKVAITKCILAAERKSHLVNSQVRSTFDPKPAFTESWYPEFMRRFASSVDLRNLLNALSGISFVVFNYDRCLENFLFSMLTIYFKLSDERAIALVEGMQIVHVYGKVGSLFGPKRVAFGGGDFPNFAEIAKSIRTFTEAITPDRADHIRGIIRGSETLVFMGFGFIEQNMALLSANDTQVRRAIATTKGLSDDDRSLVGYNLQSVVSKRVNKYGMQADTEHFNCYVEKGGCAELMKNHWFRLTSVDW